MDKISILKFAKDGYINYGGYINNFRHIPLIFDGLKPSYRRTIYGALQLCGNSNKFIKTAQLSGYVIGNMHPHGTCLSGDTLVYSLDGKLTRIKELYESGVTFLDTISYDEVTKELVPSQARLFRLGASSKIKYRVEINGKYYIECTDNHKFHTATYSIHSGYGGKKYGGLNMTNEWIQAKDLKEGMYLNSSHIHIDSINSPYKFRNISLYRELQGIDLSLGDQIHRINGSHYDNSLSNLMVLSRSEHAKFHANEGKISNTHISMATDGYKESRLKLMDSLLSKKYDDKLWDSVGCCIITRIDRIELDEEEQFYDFTVYGYNSMMIPINDDLDNLQLINVHNSSVEGVITQLVHTGIFEGQGNFGGATVTGDSFEAAASRYTEVRLDPKWHSIFSELLPFVEWEDSYIGMKMPSYLPTPIPLMLLFGGMGIGCGTGCVIPNLNARSIIEAMKSNDPWKLVPAFKDIKFDEPLCDMENLWDLGYANLSYIPTIYKGKSDDCDEGIYIDTSVDFIVPKSQALTEKINAGLLFTRDESNEEHDRLFIGKYPKSSEDMDELILTLTNELRVTDTYRLFATDGTVTKLISLRKWLQFTYNRYLGYINKMKDIKIKKYEREIKILELLPIVGKLILENPKITIDDLCSKLPDEPREYISACLSKPIKSLMRSEFSSEINSLRNQMNKVSSIDPEEYTLNILNKM